MSKVKIVAAVVDTTEITLYQQDGTKLTIPQGDPRVPTIVDQVLPIVEQGGVAEVDLSTVTHYGEFEEMVQGVIRFFRVAQKVISEALARQDIPAGKFGPVPGLTPSTKSAVDEIIANAAPVTSDKFHDTDLGKDETIVAVVDQGNGEQTVVPGMEKLEELIAYSAKNKDSIGVQNLIRRAASMIDKRQHSVEDLLRFLEKADLPIADDGSIIAYKILRRDRMEGGFVDCHTRKVTQKVGSYVCVAEALVDKNRRNECSNGLHVARRGYIGNFGGDTVTLIKVAPEDVIVVPHNDANKVRVCGYHILAELPEGAYNTLKNNKPMTTDAETSRLLAQVLKGNHIGRTEEVRITEQYGGGLVITPLGSDGQPVKKAKPSKAAKAAAPIARALDDPKARSRSVDPKQVAETVATKSKKAGSTAPAPARPAATKAKPSSTQSLPAPKTAPVEGTRQEKAAALLRTINSTAPASERGLAAVNLMALKRTSKVSYEKLGVTIGEDELKRIAHAGESAAAEAAEAAKSAPKKKAAPAAKAPPGNGNSRQVVARTLFKAKDWPALKAHKQKSKVSWEALGFTEAETETIKKRIG